MQFGSILLSFFTLFGISNYNYDFPDYYDYEYSTPNAAELIQEHQHSIGKSNSETKVIEFVDYSSTESFTFFTEVFPQIKSNYIDTEKIHYAFIPHPQYYNGVTSKLAIKAAYCAKKQNKFMEMHQALLTNQLEWTQTDFPETKFTSYAKESGIDENSFITCLDSEEMNQLINKDIKKAQNLYIYTSPTLLIGTEIFSYELNFDQVKKAIEGTFIETKL
jgi:protein-disulfide isomerase